jgi:hypothetical protein
LGQVGERISAQIPGSDIEAINYPAQLIDPMYFFSVVNGSIEVRNAIVGYNEACPGSKMAIMGPSQVCREPPGARWEIN